MSGQRDIRGNLIEGRRGCLGALMSCIAHGRGGEEEEGRGIVFVE